MRSAQQTAVRRSDDDIHEEQQQLEQQAQTILFSEGSLYAVMGMLTLAVLFCVGVLAFSIRRNDLLKTEYRRLMDAIAMRRSKTTSFPTEPDTTETPETMGPEPKDDEVTQDAILSLLTRRPISNIQHPNVNKPRTTTQPPTSSTLFYDDLDSGVKRLPELKLDRRFARHTTTAADNETTTSLSSSEPMSVTTTSALITTLGMFANASEDMELLETETPLPVTFETASSTEAELVSEVAWPSNSTDYDRNSTHLDAEDDSDDDSGDDDDA
ncbi:uncharacterized protein LOC142817323 [Rhipicephalus microplus]|uniref:uncharacterized protein LOC142817323 n=1 Tax=Rhipicephalus microplus TaxID=6941 RepID=UPI003F6C8553